MGPLDLQSMINPRKPYKPSSGPIVKIPRISSNVGFNPDAS